MLICKPRHVHPSSVGDARLILQPCYSREAIPRPEGPISRYCCVSEIRAHSRPSLSKMLSAVATQANGVQRWLWLATNCSILSISALVLLSDPRLDAESSTDTLHRRFRQAGFFGQGTATPVSSMLWLGLQSGVEQSSDLFIGYRARATGTQLIVKPVYSHFTKALTPLAHRGMRDAQALGDGLVAQAVAGQQDDPGPGHQAIRQ